MDEVTTGLHAVAVLDHVDLEEARWRVAPVGEGSHRDAVANGRAHTATALALPIDMQTRSSYYPIDVAVSMPI